MIGLTPNVVVLVAATFLLALGESLWFRFAPRYLEALGASVVVIGLWGSLTDFLDAAWQYPGGALADRVGRRGALLVLTGFGLLGLALFVVPWWPVVLVGLVFYMANTAYAQPATFAVIGDSLQRERRAVGFAIQSIMKRVPLIVGAPIAGLLITVYFGVVEGVRAGLLAAILLTILAILLQWRHFRPANPPPPRLSFDWVDMSPALKRLLVSDVLVRMGESATKVFIVLYVVTVLGFTDLDFGLMISIQALTTLLVYLPAARAADRGARRPWIVLTFLFFALYPLAIMFATSYALLMLAFIVGGLREIGEPARKASIVDMAGSETRGRVVGTYYALRGFSIMPIALLAGILWLWNPIAPFWLGATLSGLGLAVYVAMVPRE